MEVQDKYLYDVHSNESFPKVIFLNVVLMICFDDNLSRENNIIFDEIQSILQRL